MMANLLERAYTSFARHVAFPLQESWKGHSTLRILAEMEHEQWLGVEQLADLQNRRIRRLMENAFANVKYYRELFGDLHLDPSHLRSEADLQQIPLLDKTIIRSRIDDLKNANARGLQRFSTGGSTGEPLTFYLGPTRVSSDVAARCRAERWWGVGIGDSEFVIWGSPLELTKQDRLRAARDRILRTKLLSAFEMSEPVMDSYLDAISLGGCRRIFGYPSSIALLCEHAHQRRRDLSKLGIKVVFVTAEFLWDHWKETISSTFACPVANGYGGRDSGFIAHQCPHGGMHITADRLLVEIIGEDGGRVAPGEVGEIVVTHFDTPEMPFIRYRTGDMGALSVRSCTCGRGLPLLERIEGRRSDFILTPDGRMMHGLSLIYVLRQIAGVEQFRITQKAIDQFDIELVPGPGFLRDSELVIRRELEKRLRSTLTVRVRYNSVMPPTKNGKFRYIISEVSSLHSGVAATSN